MQIWYMEPYPCGDRRLPHHCFPPRKMAPDQLQQLVGVTHYKVDLDDVVAMKKRISRVKAERNVNSSDMFILNDQTLDLQEKLEEYYEPVRKEEDVVALIVDGSCYYDVEVVEDEWIRVQAERGDMIVIPAKVPHRFTVTPKNYVQIQRFFAKKETIQG